MTSSSQPLGRMGEDRLQAGAEKVRPVEGGDHHRATRQLAHRLKRRACRASQPRRRNRPAPAGCSSLAVLSAPRRAEGGAGPDPFEPDLGGDQLTVDSGHPRRDGRPRGRASSSSASRRRSWSWASIRARRSSPSRPPISASAFSSSARAPRRGGEPQLGQLPSAAPGSRAGHRAASAPPWRRTGRCGRRDRAPSCSRSSAGTASKSNSISEASRLRSCRWRLGEPELGFVEQLLEAISRVKKRRWVESSSPMSP